MQQIRSNFITVPGLIILFVLAFAAAYLGIGLLFAVLIAVFLLCLVSRLWADNSLRKLDFEVGQSELCGFPGDELFLPVEIKNNKFLPVVWLSADLPIEEGSCVSADTDDAVFSWVMPYQKLKWNEPVHALRRGVCTFSSLNIVSGDGFGLSELSVPAELKYNIEAVVYPSLLPVDISVILRKLTELEASPRGYYTDPTLLKTVLPYSMGDSYKDLNWRILAKQGELVVNKKEKLDALRMCLFVDLESCSYMQISESPSGSTTNYYVYEDKLEHMLSLAASLADAASSAGAVCSVVVPSYGDRPAEIAISEERSSQTDLLLRTLAAVDYHGERCDVPFGQLEDDYHSMGQFFCLTASLHDSRERFESFDALVWFVSAEDDSFGHVIPEQEVLI